MSRDRFVRVFPFGQENKMKLESRVTWRTMPFRDSRIRDRERKKKNNVCSAIIVRRNDGRVIITRIQCGAPPDVSHR